ncbi:MAG: hypothetical protein JNJ54_15390 [Myxococcaceae bacterium]|nr:hypothetical protein [Myxococcaceae bacterium]
MTRQGRTLQGGELAGRFAAGLQGFHDWSLAGSAGARHDAEDVEWSVHAARGEGRFTRRTWTDYQGNSAPLGDQPLDPMMLTASLAWKRLRARVLVDDQVLGQRVGYGELPGPNEVSTFRTMLGDVQADLPVGATLTLRPRATARLQVPWRTADERSPFFYDKSASRLLVGLTAFWRPLESLTLSGGVDGFWDHAWLNNERELGVQSRFDGRSTVSYGSVATWLQGQWDTPVVNVTAGGRFEWHSAVGANVAPRVALTKQLGPVNLKALYGGAFRNPSIENLNGNPTLKSERTHVAEAEVGVTVGDFTYLSVNGFYTSLNAPIVYGVDAETGEESYRNGGVVSTAGAEALVRLRGRHGSLTATAALAAPVIAEDIDTWLVPGAPTPTLLAMPLVKATAFGRLRLTQRFSLGGSAVFFSGRQALVTPTDVFDGNGVVGQLAPALLLALWLGADNLGLEGLSAQVGVGNLLDANVAFAQPYAGGTAPIPGRGREFFVRASYAFGAPAK